MSEIQDVWEDAIEQFGKEVMEWRALFVELYSAESVTCYVHMIACHAHKMLQKHKSLGKFANQGVEAGT